MKDNASFVEPVQVKKNKLPVVFWGVLFIILLGLAVGFFVSKRKNLSSNKTVGRTPSVVVSKTEAGVSDVSGYKDTAIGTLQRGGIQGEGTYHLDREGGPEHTVYLNSTVVDLGPFVGQKVEVWGQTQASQHAPWLMDVGRVKVVQ